MAHRHQNLVFEEVGEAAGVFHRHQDQGNQKGNSWFYYAQDNDFEGRFPQSYASCMSSKERRKAPVFPRLALLGLFTASVFSFLGMKWAWLSLFSHFQVYLGLTWIVFLALFRWIPAFPRAFWQPKLIWRWSILPILGHAILLGSLYIPLTAPELEAPDQIEIAWFNMKFDEDALREFEKRIADDLPDVIALGEIRPHIEVSLPGYTFKVRSPKHNLLLVSRLPLEFSKLVQVPGGGREQISTRLAVGRRRVQLVAAHIRQPIYPVHFDEFQQLAESAKAVDEIIMMGDFNSTPWASQFRGLIKDADLHHGREGRGVMNTWGIGQGHWMPLPIDHMVYKGAMELTDFEVMDWTRSDHRPIRAKFLLGGKLRRKISSDD